MKIIKTKEALALILDSGRKTDMKRVYIDQNNFKTIWGNFFYSNIPDFKKNFKETISKMKLYINVEHQTLHCNKASIRDIFNNANINCTY